MASGRTATSRFVEDKMEYRETKHGLGNKEDLKEMKEQIEWQRRNSVEVSANG